jgi:hypothetical protein
MTITPTALLSLPLITTGTESGDWGNDVNNGLTAYLDNAIAGTVTLTNDGAVTLSNTAGTNLATNIVSSLTGAGTVSAQFAIIRVTGTLTTAKVLTAPSLSKTYVVANTATGSTVTIKASGQTGVSIAVGEVALVYYNGTDYVKAASSLITALTGTLSVANGGTGVTTSTGTGNVVLSSSPTLTNPTVTNYVESVVAIGTVTTTNTLSLTSGTVQTVTLTASTTCVFTMPTATAGKSFVLLVKQAAGGSGNATFTSVKWGLTGTPTVTTTANATDIFTFIADGTYWYGSASQGYA